MTRRLMPAVSQMRSGYIGGEEYLAADYAGRWPFLLHVYSGDGSPGNSPGGLGARTAAVLVSRTESYRNVDQ
jgi:hypothetical protein